MQNFTIEIIIPLNKKKDAAGILPANVFFYKLFFIYFAR